MTPADWTLVLLTLSAVSYGLLLVFVARTIRRSRHRAAPPGRLDSGVPRGRTTPVLSEATGACGCKPSAGRYQAGASLVAYVLLALLWTLGQIARATEYTPWMGSPGQLLSRLLLYALIPLSLLFLSLTRRFLWQVVGPDPSERRDATGVPLGQGMGKRRQPALLWALGLAWLGVEMVLVEPTTISVQIAALFRWGPDYGRVAALWLAFGLLAAGWACILFTAALLTLQAYRRCGPGSKYASGSGGQRSRIAWWGVAVAMTAAGGGLFLAGYGGAPGPASWATLSGWGSLSHMIGCGIGVRLLTTARPTDVRRLVWGTLGRLTGILLMALVYTAALLVICFACLSAPSYSLWLVALVVAVVLAVAIHPLLDRLHSAVERLFSRGRGGRSVEPPCQDASTPRADPARVLLGRAPWAAAAQDARGLAELQARCTESERRTRELAAANEELVRLDQNKTELLPDIALDLRRPVAALEGYLALLRELADTGALTPALLEETMRGIGVAVQCQTEITQRLLDVSSSAGIGSGVMMTMRPTSVAEVVEAAAAQWQDGLRERKLTFSTLGLADLAPVRADGERLRQAFAELIQNAIKFTPDGGQIQVRGQWRDADRPDEEPKVEIVVADTGLGIARGDLDRVFERFYRVGDLRLEADGRTWFQAAGLGLGLSLVRDVVRAHRGRVWATSPGRDPKHCPGTEVHIVLPAPETAASPNAASPQ